MPLEIIQFMLDRQFCLPLRLGAFCTNSNEASNLMHLSEADKFCEDGR